MEQRRERAVVVCGAALMAGVAGTLMFKGAGVGLNLFLWSVGLVALGVWAARKSGSKVARSTMWLAGAGLVFAFFLAWRGSTHLLIANSMAITTVACVLAMRAHAGSVAVATAWEYTGGLLKECGGMIVAPFTMLNEIPWRKTFTGESAQKRTAVARGSLLALPLLIVFGALFSRADAVFEKTIAEALRFDAADVVTVIFQVALFGFIAAGVLYVALVGPKTIQGAPPVATSGWAKQKLGLTETSIVLGSVCCLFAIFVAIQFRFLFGGAEQVVASQGLSYADYARGGFFELVTVSLLALPLLVGARAVTNTESLRSERAVRALSTVLTALVFVVMASALRRMQLYVEAYGLTELRVSSTAFMVWLALVFGLFMASVHSRRPARFAPAAVLAGLLVIAGLNFANPDAIVARYNIQNRSANMVLDWEHLASLSADAVPTILEEWETIPEVMRGPLLKELEDQWGEQTIDIRGERIGENVARSALAAGGG